MLSRRAFGILAATSCVAPPLQAQEAMDDRSLFQQGNLYLPHYLALKTQAATGDRDAQAMLSQHAAFVGDEAAATAGPVSRTIIPAELELRAEPAITAIVERARETRVVILNESHSISGHRAFAAQVLRALRPLGFNIFAAETFNWEHSEAAVGNLQPGAPFLPIHGYYSRDPVYAEAVREALGLGYRLAGYEQTAEQRILPPNTSGVERINQREEAQARNFMDHVLAPSPDSRAVVLCGYSHVTEAPTEKAEWFASRLKRLSGIDPLTIEQSFNWPSFDPAGDPAPTRAVLERLSPTEPVVVTEPSGRAFTTEPYSDRVDLSVFHPRLAPVNGRPGWLAADPMRRATPVNFVAPGGPGLVQAVRIAEGMGAVPSDQVLIAPDQTTATLYLRRGAYIIRVESVDGWRIMGSLRVTD